VILLVLIGAVAVIAVLAGLLFRQRRNPPKITPSPRRILFPFVGAALSQRALDAALRLARAEGATIVPAYLAEVPRTLPIDSALPREAGVALPCLEAIEQRALGQHVPVDARIERGRTFRHAMEELMAHEEFDQIIVAAGANGSDGLSATDVAWLLDHAPGEIVVLRPARNGISPQLAESSSAPL
jgi:nucleotide-binding universal stress UspA family protein